MDVFVDLWSPARDLGIARKLADRRRSQRSRRVAVRWSSSGSRAEVPAGSRTFVDPGDTVAKDSGPIDYQRRGSRRIVERTTDAIPTLLEVDGAGALQSITQSRAERAACACSSIRSLVRSA